MCLVQTLTIGVGQFVADAAICADVQVFALESTIVLNGIAIDVLTLIVCTCLQSEVKKTFLLCESKLTA